MPSDKEGFLRELRATFRVEAEEHLQTITTGLMQLERIGDAAGRQPVIETVFRAAHSLKGAARAVDFGEIESICQSLENTFSAWKRGKATPDGGALEVIHGAVDRIQRAMAPGSATAIQPVQQPVPTMPAPAPQVDSDTVRVSVRALDQRLLEAEELLAAKHAAVQRGRDLDGLAPLFSNWRREWSRVQAEARELPVRKGALASEASLAEFLDWNEQWQRTLESRLEGLRRAATQDQVTVEKLVDDLLDNSKRLLMLPLGTLASLLRKVVRDLARELGKDTDLVIRGEDTRIDKRILEEMKDPLVHLLRNCLDHGIESAAGRVAARKAARASIVLAITQVNGSQVEIAVSDDGAGIDVEAVRAQAVEHGLVTASAARDLDESAVQALVFEADLSTSAMITQLSGRGLGLAIVREQAEKLGGHVGIHSTRGIGTTVRITLPHTLATFRGVLVESGQRTFVVPTAQVERVTRFRRDDIQTVEGRATLPHQGRALALVQLCDVLGLTTDARGTDDTARPALILGTGNERIAFAVDKVLEEREVLVKRLHKPLVRVRNVAGATVLASGQVAPILDVAELVKSARRAPARGAAPQASPAAEVRARRALVAEDSITSRMLLKGILESAGYEVKTAVDGLEAFTMLRSEAFDVLVSDVEMPRLNGFDLTARVRADRALAETPVVLVTALASREDRERGIEVGANAYLVKSDLDQSDLLETLRRVS